MPDYLCQHSHQSPDTISVMSTTHSSDTAVELPNRQLIEGAVRFSQRFLRWIRGDSEQSLSYPRLRVLESLHCNGPAKMRDLADELEVPARNLTSVADGLESEGLIRRTAHPTDRRVTILELTPTGSETAMDLLAPRLLEISELFDVLSETEKATLVRAFERLESAVGARTST